MFLNQNLIILHRASGIENIQNLMILHRESFFLFSFFFFFNGEQEKNEKMNLYWNWA